MHKQQMACWTLVHTYWQDTNHQVGIALIAASVIGLILLLVIRSWIRRRRLWLLIDAEIIGILTKTKNNDDGTTTTFYAPEYTYSFDGKTYVESGSYFNINLYKVGKRVSLLIDPDHPEKFRVKNKEIIGFLAACVILTLLLIFGIVRLIE